MYGYTLVTHAVAFHYQAPTVPMNHPHFCDTEGKKRTNPSWWNIWPGYSYLARVNSKAAKRNKRATYLPGIMLR